VGVFLRVLEYYRGVMFMTTNRPDMVDDAIASRCVARIQYEVPTPERQALIWAGVAKMNSVEFPAKEIKAVVAEFPSLSGRDVKNLMKLALLVTEAKGEAHVTAKTIRIVKRFKSTNDLVKEPVINAKR
jgi:AAA+ superfamily predicted ATPase